MQLGLTYNKNKTKKEVPYRISKQKSKNLSQKFKTTVLITLITNKQRTILAHNYLHFHAMKSIFIRRLLLMLLICVCTSFATSPTSQPSGEPTGLPTNPTSQPSSQPTSMPSVPTSMPSSEPTLIENNQYLNNPHSTSNFDYIDGGAWIVIIIFF